MGEPFSMATFPMKVPWGSADSSDREKDLYNASTLAGRDENAPKSISEYSALPTQRQAMYNSSY